MRDMERIGKADQVAVLVLSEFGRPVPENANQGADHGTANPMFIIDLMHTTDFRRAGATMTQGWMGYRDTDKLLKGRFELFPVFG